VLAGLFSDYFRATIVLLVLFHGCSRHFAFTIGMPGREPLSLPRPISIHNWCYGFVSAQVLCNVGAIFLASGLFHGSCPLGPSELHSAHAARHLAWEEFENVIAEAARLWLRLAAMGQNYGTVSAGLFADYFWATFVLLVLFHGAQPTFRYYGWHSRTEAFVTLARRVSIHTLCGWVISAQLLFIGGLFK
jgi:hypothetical protein